MMYNIQNNKSLIDTTVILLSTGNNLARGYAEFDDINIKKGKVLNVAKVNIIVRVADGYEKAFKVTERNGNIHIESGYNSGYYLFKTQQSFDIYKRSKDVRLFLINNLQTLTDEKLIDIGDILGIK